jgi:hypothetical protein
VMMMLRPSTISEDDAASLKRALLRNLRSWDLQQVGRRAAEFLAISMSNSRG